MLAVTVVVMTPIIGFVNVHYNEGRQRDAALRLAQDEIARFATLAERDRIAADLHDLLGHTLSVIVLKSGLASKLMTRDTARAAVEIADVERISRDALAEVRRAVHGFRAATLSDELVRARGVLETAGIRAEVDATGVPSSGRVADLNPPLEHAAALILRESITNVVRHSQATHCRIAIAHSDGTLRLEIVDDGVGGQSPDGHGLEGMRVRAREIGGVLERDGSRGMTIRLTAPTTAGAAAEAARMIRVLLAEDQAMVLGALAALLEIESDLQVVGRAANGREALALARSAKPDVIVTDIEMPEMTGLELSNAVKTAGLSARVVILTTFARPGYLRRALEAGASAYLLKDTPSDQLADAIRRVHAGTRVIDPALAAEAWSEADPLTDRERQVLRLAADGLSSPDIAAALSLTEGTVRNYLSEAISKLGARNRVEAANLARAKGWL